jgi:hypothetical protein
VEERACLERKHHSYTTTADANNSDYIPSGVSVPDDAANADNSPRWKAPKQTIAVWDAVEYVRSLGYTVIPSSVDQYNSKYMTPPPKKLSMSQPVLGSTGKEALSSMSVHKRKRGFGNGSSLLTFVGCSSKWFRGRLL